MAMKLDVAFHLLPQRSPIRTAPVLYRATVSLIVDALQVPGSRQQVPVELTDSAVLSADPEIVPLDRPFPPFLAYAPCHEHLPQFPLFPPIEESKRLTSTALPDLEARRLLKQLSHLS